MDTDDARRELGSFLVERPLYVTCTIETAHYQDETSLVPYIIRRFCDACTVETNWSRKEKVQYAAGRHGCEWTCSQCASEAFCVWLDAKSSVGKGITGPSPKTGEQTTIGSRIYRFRKMGQWPAWSIRPDPALEKALTPEDRELYRKALMNMSAGYGLGALAYFQRIVENETTRLLDVVAELARDEEDAEKLEALELAKKGHNADERLRLAAEATPASLRVGGVNPIKALYGMMSAGVHAGSEDECNDLAARLRATFEYIFRHIRQVTAERAELRRILNAPPFQGKTKAPKT